MDYIGIAVIVLITALTALMLKKYNSEQSMIISLAAGVIISIVIVQKIVEPFNQMYSMFENAGVSSNIIRILLKTLGISLIAQFASDACKDAGESSLAAKVEFAARAEILILALPLFKKVAALAVSLIK